MTDIIVLKANAKINLSLNVTGVADGMHLLDMVLVSIDKGDKIQIKKKSGDGISVKFFGAEIDPIHNTAYQAARLMQSKFGIGGLDIFIDKQIPIKGGLGGSSADASGVIVGLGKMFDIDLSSLDASQIARSVGSDVVYQMQGGFQRVTGAGEGLSQVESCVQEQVAVIGGLGGVDTRECFKAFDNLFTNHLTVSDNDLLIAALTSGGDYHKHLGNALIKSAETVNPKVKEAHAYIKSLGLPYNMSGSGDSFYVITKDAHELAAAAQKKGYAAFTAVMKNQGIEIVSP